MVQKTVKSKGAKMIGVKVTPLENKKIHKLVEAGVYLNTSDFMRDAVRDKLEDTEVIYLREVDYKTAKKEVLAYYKKFREAYPDEAAEDLRIDAKLVFKITGELIHEKRLGVIE